MKCPKCGADMQWDGAVCTSLPPKYMHKCILCGHVEYLDSPDVTVEEEPMSPFDYDDIKEKQKKFIDTITLDEEGAVQECAKMSREVMYEAFRAKAAIAAMQSLVTLFEAYDPKSAARKAVEYANALIEELKKQ